ncbi:hypothetical protein KIN20_031724 [Parelaphostrongylus tenuis]|uniref:Uncharacterized protein n=1 Tax=Parelaphostrongylus tenuis TaxID=148309 RepID=A0AAD5R5J9_PARTN|nr:hypothetical protein KIN20_031724 [Parelaphostrongylus tenuis]
MAPPSPAVASSPCCRLACDAGIGKKVADLVPYYEVSQLNFWCHLVLICRAAMEDGRVPFVMRPVPLDADTPPQNSQMQLDYPLPPLFMSLGSLVEIAFPEAFHEPMIYYNYRPPNVVSALPSNQTNIS